MCNVYRPLGLQAVLSTRLKEAGFTEFRSWDPDCVANHNFRNCANSDTTQSGKAFPVSLNLEAVR
jgi:hypothetical protein